MTALAGRLRGTPRRGIVALLLAAQLLVLAAAGAVGVTRWLHLPLDDDGMYVLLVMGSDQGPPREGAAREGRADAIHLLVIDEDRAHVSILSIPRDSYVPVAGLGTTKINAMLTLGPDNAVRTIEDLTGLEVDDWVLTGFHGLMVAVDEFGGVEVDVEQRLYDPRGASTDLQPGTQMLVGWQALAYTRDRYSRPDGDIGRSTGQAKVLRSLHTKLVDEMPSPARLVDYASMFRRNTETSFSSDRLFRLAYLALTIDPDDVAQVTLPGNVGTAGEASVYRLSDGAFQLFADLREDGLLSQLEPADGDG